MAKSYAEYCKESFGKLTKVDQRLFDDVIEGLIKTGWRDSGGNRSNLEFLNKDGAEIKVFRQAESPEVIYVRFSAPPENPKEWLKGLNAERSAI